MITFLIAATWYGFNLILNLDVSSRVNVQLLYSPVQYNGKVGLALFCPYSILTAPLLERFFNTLEGAKT